MDEQKPELPIDPPKPPPANRQWDTAAITEALRKAAAHARKMRELHDKMKDK